MKIFIKNMVCLRCKIIVAEQLDKACIPYSNIDLGYANINSSLTDEQRLQLNAALKNYGLELIDNRKNILAERIKNILIEHINSNELISLRLSQLLEKKLKYDYTYLSNIFSDVEKRTIENFVITQKIEKVKELLLYEDLTLTEIAYKLNYCSLAHLSYQFKKVTGLTSSQFKKSKDKNLVL